MRRELLLAFILIYPAAAGSALYLKTRTIETAEAVHTRSAKWGSVRTGLNGKTHLLLQYDHVPGEADLQALEERGAVSVAYVHENGLVVAVEDPSALNDVPLRYAGRLDPADKISPLLGTDGDAVPVLIEFHSDIDRNDGRRILLEQNLELIENPDLSPHQLMTKADPEQVLVLADRDEVSYVFPAATELAEGKRMVACTGALTTQGEVGQYIARMGEGWDGPGLGSASLGYYFAHLSTQLPAAASRSEIVRAFTEWAKYVQLTFHETAAPGAARTINVMFARRDHGDQYPFDGPGGTLGHTFYPSPPNPEPLAGDLHLDDDESWAIRADVDLYSVVLHEIGHALGLGHSDRPGAVMYPYYARASTLTQDDIDAIRSLYAVLVSTSTGPEAPAGGTTPDTSGSSTPEPPATPTTPTTPTTPSTPTTPTTPTPKATVPLTLTVSAPFAMTSADSIQLAGMVSGGSGAAIISWKSDRGQAGIAFGLPNWSAQVPLSIGPNTITITATDVQQMSVSKLVAVTRQAVPVPVPVPVTIAITDPAGAASVTTAQPVINLRGTANHPSGIQEVTWSSDRGASGTASGTMIWQTGSIPLQAGANTISVRAIAIDRSTASATINVPYTPSTGYRDTTAPSITILSPGSVTPVTSADSITVSGTSSDNVGVQTVTWFSSTGDNGTASGTTSWTTPAIPLIQGTTTIMIRAFDAAGNVGWRSINVTRR